MSDKSIIMKNKILINDYLNYYSKYEDVLREQRLQYNKLVEVVEDKVGEPLSADLTYSYICEFYNDIVEDMESELLCYEKKLNVFREKFGVEEVDSCWNCKFCQENDAGIEECSLNISKDKNKVCDVHEKRK